MQLLSEVLCSVSTQIHTCFEGWWFSRHRYPCVDKDLRVSDPALLVPEEPLGFFGCWTLVVEISDLYSTCPAVVQSVKTGQTSAIAFVTVVLTHQLILSLSCKPATTKQVPASSPRSDSCSGCLLHKSPPRAPKLSSEEPLIQELRAQFLLKNKGLPIQK